MNAEALEAEGAVLDAALEYARNGRPVFPCTIDKRPITPHGFKDATADPDTIRQWWAQYPDALIGAPTGKTEFVLDVDAPDGPASLAALEAQHEPLPPTKEQATGGGGRQLFFKVPPRIEIKNSAGKIGVNLDIRAPGGYSIIPPSMHKSGNRYRWVNDLPVADAPAWLIDAIVAASTRIEPTPKTSDNRPGDDFNKRGDIRPLLERAGWQFFKNSGANEHWTRPGKSTGNSGTIFEDGSFFPFTGNAPPVESNKRYSRYAVYALLEHGGDFSAAARELARQGYGETEGNRKETTKETTRKLVAVDIADFLAREFPPRENLLAPWLPRQGLTMIFAERGIGKTFLALSVAVAVAAGGRLLNWHAPKPAGVLYIDGEMPAVVLQERLARIIASTDQEPTAPLKILTPDLQPAGMIDLTSTEDQAGLEPLLEGVSLIIADNLSCLCRNGNENEGESWLPVQEWALRQRAAGRSVLFIHHAGKTGLQRGTSRREDVLDTVIALRRPAGYTPDQGAAFVVKYEKARGFYGEDSKAIEAALTKLPSGRQEWTTKSVEGSTVEKVADLLNQGVEQKAIPALLGITKGAVSKAKAKAVSLKMLTQVSSCET